MISLDNMGDEFNKAAGVRPARDGVPDLAQLLGEVDEALGMAYDAAPHSAEVFQHLVSVVLAIAGGAAAYGLALDSAIKETHKKRVGK